MKEELESKLRNILDNYESKAYLEMGEHSQFTIDFIDDLVDRFFDWEEDGDDERCEIEIIIDSFHYRIYNVLEIIKEVKDKILLETLLTDLEEIKI